MKLYHATTHKKYRRYHETGYIKAPVRGFTTIQAAMAWSMKVTGRTMIIEIEADNCHKLPDHHNKFGDAYWNDGDVVNFKCIFNAEVEA